MEFSNTSVIVVTNFVYIYKCNYIIKHCNICLMKYCYKEIRNHNKCVLYVHLFPFFNTRTSAVPLPAVTGGLTSSHYLSTSPPLLVIPASLC